MKQQNSIVLIVQVADQNNKYNWPLLHLEIICYLFFAKQVSKLWHLKLLVENVLYVLFGELRKPFVSHKGRCLYQWVWHEPWPCIGYTWSFVSWWQLPLSVPVYAWAWAKHTSADGRLIILYVHLTLYVLDLYPFLLF